MITDKKVAQLLMDIDDICDEPECGDCLMGKKMTQMEEEVCADKGVSEEFKHRVRNAPLHGKCPLHIAGNLLYDILEDSETAKAEGKKSALEELPGALGVDVQAIAKTPDQ